MKVRDKVWLVTGAGSGMGRELSLHLLQNGADVAMVDINMQGLQETESLGAHTKRKISTHAINITDQEAVAKLPDEVVKLHGRVDGIVNMAGIIQPFIAVKDLDMPTIRRVMDVNFYGPLGLIKSFLPFLASRPEAHIVNVSSMGGFVPVPGQTIYGASKAALKLLSEGLASELLGTSIKVTTVFPGAVATNITVNSGVEAPSASKESSIVPLEASKAAEIIVRAVERNKQRVMVGKDARSMDILSRLAPVKAARIIAEKMKELLKS